MKKNKEYWYELSVKNFKNIINKTEEDAEGSENGTILFFQNKLNIIVGKNNTGKTNILKAIIYSQNITDVNNKFLKYIGDYKPLILTSSYLTDRHADTDVFLKMNFSDNMKEEIKEEDLKVFLKEEDNLFLIFGRKNEINSNDKKENDLNYFNVVSESKNNQDVNIIIQKLSNYFKNEGSIKPKIIPIVNKKDEFLSNDELERYGITNEWSKDYNLVAFLKAFSSNYEDIKKKMNELVAPIPSSKLGTNQIIVKDNLEKQIIESINSNLEKLFKENFECLDFYPSVIINGSNLIVKIKSFNNYEVDGNIIGQQGTGIKNLLLLLLTLEKNKYDKMNNFLYLIDELEDGLTINLQEKVVNYLYSFVQNYKNVTIIYTTHSPSLLPKFEEIDKLANIIVAYRRKTKLKNKFSESEDRKELYGELLTYSSDNFSEINETGAQLLSSDEKIESSTGLMKFCLDLNEETAKKLYESENENSNQKDEI